MEIYPCPLKDYCRFKSNACAIEDLMNLCYSDFPIGENAICGICGKRKDCYKINDDVQVCQECLKSFNLPRIAQMAGIGTIIPAKIIKRT